MIGSTGSYFNIQCLVDHYLYFSSVDCDVLNCVAIYVYALDMCHYYLC
jgi:hypothetical protein